jgi:hypothetical protein
MLVVKYFPVRHVMNRITFSPVAFHGMEVNSNTVLLLIIV